jgi:hypothetical protein
VANRPETSGTKLREYKLLRGEDIETLSRELGVTAATLSGWREQSLIGMEANLKAREADVENEETQRLDCLTPAQARQQLQKTVLRREIS